MSKVVNVCLRIKQAMEPKTIEVKTSRVRIAEDVNGQPVQLRKEDRLKISNSMRELEDLLFGNKEEIKATVDTPYFKLRFNGKELHAMIMRLEEIIIQADLEHRIWDIRTHSNGSFRVAVVEYEGNDTVVVQQTSAGYGCSIRNITTVVKKDTTLMTEIEQSKEALEA